MPESTLRDRINGKTSKAEARPIAHRLTITEEEAIVEYVLDLYTRRFPSRLAGIEDMANLHLSRRDGGFVGKHWADKFVKRQSELKCVLAAHTTSKEPSAKIQSLLAHEFLPMHNMRAKYGILDCDFYNFDETGFMMGVICASMVVTRADRRGRGKAVQPGNREWATAVECINGEGWCLPPFIIVQGAYHLANWYTESDLPLNWAIKPT